MGSMQLLLHVSQFDYPELSTALPRQSTAESICGKKMLLRMKAHY